tara:strand:+ start:5073 stop:5687 length:615 start_codon:yes stop_codon:yes gene_type:complete
MKHKESISEVLDELNRPPDVLYDIGVGHLPHNEAEQFKERYPDIRVFGTEPQMNPFLERKGEYCGELYPWGIWSHREVLELNLTKDFGNSSVLEKMPEHHAKVVGTEWISCISLDDFDEVCGKLDNIFLWMDIEGAEYQALLGASYLLGSGRAKWIDVELSDSPRRKGDMNADKITDYLGRYGYTAIKEYGQVKCSHHNALFAL